MTESWLAARPARAVGQKPIADMLNKLQSSFPRRREPSQINKLDTRLRGYDDFISASLNLI